MKLKAFGLELRIWKLLGEDQYIIVNLPQGLGDILQFLMHLEGYKKLHPGKKVAVVVTKPHFLELVQMYKSVVDKVLYLSPEQTKMMEKGRYGGEFKSGWWRIYDVTSPRLYLHYAVMAAYGIPSNTPAFIPEIKLTKKKMRKLERLGIFSENTVIIAPEAVSCDETVTQDVWLNVASYLETEGYKVFFNSRNEAYGRERLLFLPLWETVEAVMAGNGFIGYRSGLCDVIAAFTSSRQIVVYPNNMKVGEHAYILGYDQNPNEKYLEYCSLKNIYPEKEIRELIYSQDSLFSTVKEVFGHGQDSH